MTLNFRSSPISQWLESWGYTTRPYLCSAGDGTQGLCVYVNTPPTETYYLVHKLEIMSGEGKERAPSRSPVYKHSWSTFGIGCGTMGVSRCLFIWFCLSLHLLWNCVIAFCCPLFHCSSEFRTQPFLLSGFLSPLPPLSRFS